MKPQSTDNFLAGLGIGAFLAWVIWYACSPHGCDPDMQWALWLQCVNR